MAARPKKPARQTQRCPRCGHKADLPSASGACLCPRCVLRCKWVDMRPGKAG